MPTSKQPSWLLKDKLFYGWIFDMSGSYNWSFVTAAACMTGVGLLVFLAQKEKF